MRPVGGTGSFGPEMSCYEAQALDRHGEFLPCPQCNLLAMMRELERKSREIEKASQQAQVLNTSTSTGSLSVMSSGGGRQQPLIVGSLLERSMVSLPLPGAASMSSSVASSSASTTTTPFAAAATSALRRHNTATTRRSPPPSRTIQLPSPFKPSMVRAGYVLGSGPLGDDVIFRPIKKSRGLKSPSRSRSRSPSRSPSRAPSPHAMMLSGGPAGGMQMRPASPLTISPLNAFEEDTVGDWEGGAAGARSLPSLPAAIARPQGVHRGKSAAKAAGHDSRTRAAVSVSPASMLSIGTAPMFSPGPSPFPPVDGRQVFVPISAGRPVHAAAGSVDSPQSTVVAAYLAQAYTPAQGAGSGSFGSFYVDTFPDPLADDMANLSLASEVSVITPTPTKGTSSAVAGTAKRPKTPASATIGSGRGSGRGSSSPQLRTLRSVSSRPSSRASTPSRRARSPATTSIDLYEKLKDELEYSWGSLSDASVRRYNERCSQLYSLRKNP